MTRLWVDLRNFARGCLRGMRTNPVTTAVAVVTIAITLVLLGAFALLVANMQDLLGRFGDDLRVTAYLSEDTEPARHAELARSVGTIEGVLQVDLVTKEEALERFRASVGAQAGLLEALDENPLPASLEIVLAPERRNAAGLRAVVEALDGLPGVAELAYGQEWVEGYARFVGLVRGLVFGAACVLGVAALGIVSNTIRLAVYARREEIEILGLVGASRPYIATPFLLEGLVEGALGGLAALVVLYGLFHLVLPQVESGLSLLIGFAEPRFFGPGGALRLVASGAGLGLLGSTAAMLRGWRS